MLEAKEIAAMKVRCEGATPGPWESGVSHQDNKVGADPIMIKGEGIHLTGGTTADRDFIAHARQDIPNLIAEVERLVSLIFQRQSMLRVYADFNDCTEDDAYWILYYRHKKLAEQITDLGLAKGDKVVLYQDPDDFEVTATLDYRTLFAGVETLVAIPDWSTLVRKLDG